jgi:hypothetical protein
MSLVLERILFAEDAWDILTSENDAESDTFSVDVHEVPVMPAVVADRCVLPVMPVPAVVVSRRCSLDNIDLPVTGRVLPGGGELGPAGGDGTSGESRDFSEKANGLLLGLFLPLMAGGLRGS